MGGRGEEAPDPWGRRHWVGINFCHLEVVKLQQQCHTCRILFLIYPTTGSILFFSGRGRVPIYPGDSNRRIGRKNENDNPVRVVYMFFNYYINLLVFHDIRSSFRVQTCTWRNWNNLQKGCFYIVVSQGNSGNKVEKWQFLDLKSNNCVEFSMFNVFS